MSKLQEKCVCYFFFSVADVKKFSSCNVTQHIKKPSTLTKIKISKPEFVQYQDGRPLYNWYHNSGWYSVFIVIYSIN